MFACLRFIDVPALLCWGALGGGMFFVVSRGALLVTDFRRLRFFLPAQRFLLCELGLKKKGFVVERSRLLRVHIESDTVTRRSKPTTLPQFRLAEPTHDRRCPTARAP